MKRGTGEDLAALLKRSPKLIRVLERHGVHVCAGCLLTLTSPVERAAAYHGVPDVPAFLAALGLRPPVRRKHGRRRPGGPGTSPRRKPGSR